MHPIWHAGILLTVTIVSEFTTWGKRDITCQGLCTKTHKHALELSGADLCCEGYLLGEYMLLSLLEGPMLF